MSEFIQFFVIIISRRVVHTEGHSFRRSTERVKMEKIKAEEFFDNRLGEFKKEVLSGLPENLSNNMEASFVAGAYAMMYTMLKSGKVSIESLEELRLHILKRALEAGMKIS